MTAPRCCSVAMCWLTRSGLPADGARPLLRAVAHVRTATCCWIAAAAGGYHDGENTLAGWGS